MTTDPTLLHADLAYLLDDTFGPHGLPGVLADWIDERSAYWAPLAALLRVSQPAPDTRRGFNIGFRYRHVCPGVVFWVASVNHNSKWFGAPPDGDVLLGAYRALPGREAMWGRVVPKDEINETMRAELWGLFLSPDGPPATA